MSQSQIFRAASTSISKTSNGSIPALVAPGLTSRVDAANVVIASVQVGVFGVGSVQVKAAVLVIVAPGVAGVINFLFRDSYD